MAHPNFDEDLDHFAKARCVHKDYNRFSAILNYPRRMVSSGMLRRVALVRPAVSEALRSSETSVLTRATRRNIPEVIILHSHRRENLNYLRRYVPDKDWVRHELHPGDTNITNASTYKRTPWPLVRKRTIPTERPQLTNEILCQLLWMEGRRVVSAADPPRSLISVF
jgi:hypothetical protein